MDTSLDNIKKLSLAERILLVEEIWDSIVAEAKPESFKITTAQQKEIERRLGLYKNGQTETHTWKEVKASIKTP